MNKYGLVAFFSILVLGFSGTSANAMSCQDAKVHFASAQTAYFQILASYQAATLACGATYINTSNVSCIAPYVNALNQGSQNYNNWINAMRSMGCGIGVCVYTEVLSGGSGCLY